jgi:hypothetical protein
MSCNVSALLQCVTTPQFHHSEKQMSSDSPVSTERGGVQPSPTENRHSLLPVKMESARPREQDSLTGPLLVLLVVLAPLLPSPLRSLSLNIVRLWLTGTSASFQKATMLRHTLRPLWRMCWICTSALQVGVRFRVALVNNGSKDVSSLAFEARYVQDEVWIMLTG